jgi:hypothetical protein
MKMEYADEIAEEYKTKFSQLVNTYCQLKDSHQFNEFPKVSSAIWRVQALAEGWEAIACRLARQIERHYDAIDDGEGYYEN